MSKQFTFHLTPEDSLNLIVYLKEGFDVIFLADESKQAKPEQLSELMATKESIIILARRKDLDSIHFDEIETRKIWSVDSLTSPVIEFSNCYFDGKILGPGRMYCTTGYYDDDEVWTVKDSTFLEWVETIFKITKKHVKRNTKLEAYLGKEAETLVNEEKVKISSFI